MMLFVAGASGVLGRRVVARAVAAGHVVSGVARSTDAATTLRRLGARPIEFDLFDPGALFLAVAGHDVVLNLATAIPPLTRALWPRAFTANDALRGTASRHLVDATLASGAGRYVRESVTMAYPDHGASWIEEDLPLQPETHLRTVAAAEADTRRLEAAGHTTVVLRFGFFYGPDAVHTREELRFARHLRLSTVIGASDAYYSVIHLDDAADAVLAALCAPAGIYNVVDDEPLTRRAHVQALATALGVGTLHRLPPRLTARAGAPARAMMRSHRASNRSLRAATHWRPDHRDAREGWHDIVANAR